jgi:hypothetical protein
MRQARQLKPVIEQQQEELQALGKPFQNAQD